MPGPILPIAAPSPVDAIRPAGAATTAGTAFQEVFSSAVRTVEAFGQDASASVERFLSGDGEELHTAVLATERADLAFELFLQTRNKVVSAYQTIMQMQL
jgi:flagellar hook-basal body complex protein FliE